MKQTSQRQRRPVPGVQGDDVGSVNGIETAAADNWKPSKKKTWGRIDGIVGKAVINVKRMQKKGPLMPHSQGLRFG